MTVAVLFDFGGTLDADGVRWSVRFHHAYRAAGGELSFQSFEPLFQHSDQLLSSLPGIRPLGFRSTVEAQARLLGRLLPDARGVSWLRIAERFYTESLATVERNRALLVRLATRYRLGMISDFAGNLAPCLEELGLAHLFQLALDSGAQGIEKPDPRLFTRALETLDTPPGDAWMVGDSFEDDIQPARAIGMRACWIGGPRSRQTAGVVAIQRLVDLEEILAPLTAAKR